MQPVGGFVRLRAEGFAEAAHGVQFAVQRLEFGVVAQGEHPAEPVPDVRGVEHHHVLRGEVDLVPRRGRGEDGAEQRLGQAQRADRPALQLSGESEQFAGGVVAEHHPVVAVQQHQALAHGVQGGLVVLVQVAELGGAHAVGVPAQPGAEQVAAEPAEGEGGQCHAGQGEQRVAQPVADGLDGDADADQREHVPAVVEHRGDHPDGGAEGAGVRLAPGLPGECLLDVAEVGPADLGGVGVGPAHAVGVHHGDEGDAGVCHDVLRVRLEHGAGVGAGDGGPDGGRVRDRPGDGGDLGAGGVLGPVRGEQVGEDGAAGHHDGDDHDLHDEQLPGEAAHRPARRSTRTQGHASQCALSGEVPGKPRCGSEP